MSNTSPQWSDTPRTRVVLSTAPPGEAQALATKLVTAGLAACINVVPGIRSIYRWKGGVSNDPESLLVIKTSAERLPALRAAMADAHSYEVPEIAAFAPLGITAVYDEWVVSETADPNEGSEPQKPA